MKAVNPRRSQNTTVTLAPVAFEQTVGPVRGGDQRRHLRGQEALEPADPLDLRHLGRDPVLERAVPLGEFMRLPLELGGLLLHGIVQRLDAQHGADPGHEGRLIERLDEVIVAARLEPRDHVLDIGLGGEEDHRHETQRRIRLEAFERTDAVELRHHDVEQDQVGPRGLRHIQRLFAVFGRDHLVAGGLEPHAHDLEIGRHIVDGQDAGRMMHGPAPQVSGRKERTRASTLRGLKGLAT